MPELLDPRLRVAASFVRQGVKLADVGCDHGYLITQLYSDGVITGGVACDVNEMPLATAKKLVAELGYSEKISCRLGDGLSCVAADEADDVVIAGMGGTLIFDILMAVDWTRDSTKRFILQPMTKISYLRGQLLNEGFCILAEKACLAQGKYYTVMQVQYSGERVKLADFHPYYYLGELQNNPSPAAREVVMHSVNALRQRAAGILTSSPEEAAALQTTANKLVDTVKDW